MNTPTDYIVFKITILKRSVLLIGVALLLALLSGNKGLAAGVLVGGLVSMAIFSLLYKYVLTLASLSMEQRKKFIIPRALLVYTIMGATLFIAITKGVAVFLGAAAGLFVLKIAIFLEIFKDKRCRAMN
ncbi:hypothetical protein ACFL0T_07690 [Candidatus Omnitrophota bacterium]